MLIFLQEVFDNDHRVISQKGSSKGRFTFTAADSGDHKLCFTPSSNSGNSGWLSALHPMGGIKLTLDLAIGETSAIESTDKGKIQDIVQKVKDLNGRLQDIRREQVFQRVGLRSLDRRGWIDDSYAILTTDRNVRLSSEISPSRQMRGWYGGQWHNWWYWVSLVRGNFLICGPSSSSKS
jgi:hypothetical protein